MMTDLTRWQHPLIHAGEILYLSGIYDDCEGFRVALFNATETQYYTIEFEALYGYRNLHQAKDFKTITALPSSITHCNLFKTQKTAWAAWLSADSLGAIDIDSIYHYLILTPSGVLEILSSEEAPYIEAADMREK